MHPHSPPRLIGRTVELAQLEHHLALTRQGAGRIVFVSGEAGIGKSHLLRSFVRQHPAVQVLEGRCDPGSATLPYGPFFDLLLALQRNAGTKAITEAAGPLTQDLDLLLPEIGTRAGASSNASEPQGQKRRTFEAIYRVLRSPAQAPRVVVLEDLHWVDDTSLELLRYFAVAVQHDPLLVIGTYRSDDLHRRHPLRSLLASLAQEHLSHELRLPPFTTADLTDLLGDWVPKTSVAALADLFMNRTRGHPLFTLELLRTLRESGRLESLVRDLRDGHEGFQLDLPASLKANIMSRLSGFDDGTLEVLRDAAVLGMRFEFDVLLELSGTTEPVLARMMASLVTRGILIEERTSEDTYGFTHALTHEAVYDDMLGRERRRRHAAALAVLERRHALDTAAVVEALAHHSLQARDLVKAAGYTKRAGEHAMGMHAYREAVRHFKTALELHEPEDPRERADLSFKLALGTWHLGSMDRASRYMRDAQTRYDEMGDSQRVSETHRYLSVSAWMTGNLDEAEAHLEKAVQILQEGVPTPELGLAYSSLARFSLWMLKPSECRHWSEQAVGLGRNLEDQHGEGRALIYLGRALLETGDVTAGLEAFASCFSVLEQSGCAECMLMGHHLLGETLLQVGELAQAEDHLQESIRIAKQVGMEAFGVGELLAATVRLERGAWSEALAAAEQVLSGATVSIPFARFLGATIKGELLVRKGETAAARRTLEAVVSDIQLGFASLRDPLPVLAYAQFLEGDQVGARDTINRWHDGWLELEPMASSGEATAYGLRVYLALRDEQKSQALLEELEVITLLFSTPLTLARLEEARGLLAAAASRHDDAARHFQAAAQGWRELSYGFQEARARRHRAVSLLELRPPARAEAIAELKVARAVFTALGATLEDQVVQHLVKTHGLRGHSTRRKERDALTQREREVLNLIKQGHSNKKIASSLGIADRTAEHHVANVLSKLGFSSRLQAATHVDQDAEDSRTT